VRDPLEQIAESFLARLRAGERPAVSEYEARHPDLADDIRSLFPALIMMEEGRGCVEKPPAADSTPATPEQVPRQLGEYRLLREIGRGGMGVVYEAVQESLGRHVALKILPAGHLIQPEQLARFRREARAAARLHHTNIVPVFGVGEDQGIHYYAMQFIHGQGLDAVLDDVRCLRAKDQVPPRSEQATVMAQILLSGRFQRAGNVTEIADPAASPPSLPSPATPPPTASASGAGTSSNPSLHGPYYASVSRIALQAAEALDYAHSQGVIHRDIKPSNLLLDTEGRLWITDFGLAKAEGAEELTQAGAILGTFRYMAPERFQGLADARSDVYALGATLYELLTLRPAFDQGNRGLLVEEIVNRDPPSPRKLDVRIPRDLETMVLKALAKEPGRRYATAADLAEDLSRFLADRPIRARRTPWSERAWRWCRRNPAPATLLFAVILAVLLGTGVSWLFALQAQGEARRADKKADEERAAARREKAEKESAWLNLYIARTRLAQTAWSDGDIPLLRRLLDETCPQPGQQDLRSFEWYYLARLGRREPTTVKHTSPVGCVHFSPDGKYLASAYVVSGFPAKGGGKVWNAATGEVILSLPEHEGGYALAFRPDGKCLATNRLGKTEVWDLGTSRVVLTLQAGAGIVTLAFSPDGKQLAVGPGLWDLETGKLTRSLQSRGRSWAYALAFSPDGKRLASGGFGPTAKIWEVATGREVLLLTSHTPDVFSVAFSPDGKLLASSSGATVRVWDANAGHEAFCLLGHRGNVLGVAFSPDGKRLASCSADHTIKCWDLETGREAFSLKGHTAMVCGLDFSPDGKTLASASSDGTVKVWDLVPFPVDKFRAS
jgi:serine/threonine protein kinase